MQIFLETERLILRRFTADDADLLVELDSDPEVLRYVTGGPPTPARRDRERHPARLPPPLRARRTLRLLGGDRESDRGVPGLVPLPAPAGADDGEPELGYRLRRSAWGKGFGTEGSRALIRKGFTDFGVRRVVASAAAANIASRRVMEKCGLTLVRTYRITFPDLFGGEEQEDVEYALTRSGWERQEAATSSSM
jgi:RimJ/RimL family protein N-acetyltransferase